MDDILERLRKLWVHRVGTDDDLVSIYREAAAEIERLREERDEAQRNLCFIEAANLSFGPDGVPYHPSVAHKIAENYGWDCFKDYTDG